MSFFEQRIKPLIGGFIYCVADAPVLYSQRTGELIVAENCELELAQDAVLDFHSATNEVIPETFKCITLSSSSRLIGNHATIYVPYSFEGTVICTADDGFRYLKDINIVKLVEQNTDNSIHSNLVGFPLSLNKESNGTALLIKRNNEENSDSNELCQLKFSGINIAGAFNYGIKCINTMLDETNNRNFNTHINAFIDGCRTGVYMNNYSNARVSAIIAPRHSYDPTTAEETYQFAEHGVFLENSTNIDLRDSRIKYRNFGSIESDSSIEFRYVELLGNCQGLMIYSSLCSRTENSNVRDYIHTNTLENFDNMTILGESNADYFNCERDSAIGIIFPNYRVGTSDTLVPDNDRTASGFIPCEKDLTIYLKAISFELDDLEDVTYNRIVVYNENKNKIYAINGKYFNSNKYFDYKYTSDSNTTEIKIKNTDVKYIRFCCNSTGITYDSSVKVYDKIFMCKDGYLKDRIYIKTEYIKGLEENLQQLSNRITALENSVKD